MCSEKMIDSSSAPSVPVKSDWSEARHSVVIGATKDGMTACYKALATSDTAQYDALRLTDAEVAAISGSTRAK